MKVGIIGIGAVGSAVKHGFEKLGHEVLIHDIKYNTSIDEVLDSEVAFICVPTPSANNGMCDISIVDNVICELDDSNYNGVIAIKSTIIPGTTRSLIKKYPNLKICFVPEFLRERCAEIDFIENHDICIVGTQNDEFYEVIKTSHGKFPKKFLKVTETEAELVKYFNNVYNSTLITFANNFYEICKSLDVDYDNVKTAACNRVHINDVYLDCNENLRGFGGVCLPKDTAALAALGEELGLKDNFFNNILDQNKKYKTTVFDKMRMD